MSYNNSIGRLLSNSIYNQIILSCSNNRTITPCFRIKYRSYRSYVIIKYKTFKTKYTVKSFTSYDCYSVVTYISCFTVIYSKLDIFSCVIVGHEGCRKCEFLRCICKHLVCIACAKLRINSVAFLFLLDYHRYCTVNIVDCCVIYSYNLIELSVKLILAIIRSILIDNIKVCKIYVA